MMLLVFLSGLLLHFLLLHWTESAEQKVNLTALAEIIDFFEQNYTKKTAEGLEPYAVAINVPMNQCQESFNSSILPTEENATRVRNDIYNKDNKFHKGKDLIAAGLLNCTEKKNASEKCKSKPVFYLLINGSSSFSNFLNRTDDSCVVIYSLYYPCQFIPDGYNITPALETLKKHNGIKAFVFSKVYPVETEQTCSYLAQNCKEIVKHVPIYHFVNNTVINIKQCQHQ